jgi:ferritin
MEQVEEEASAKDLVERLSLVGDDKGALISLDLELAKRQFVEENE